VRRQILKAYVRIFLLKRYDRKRQLAHIAGYTVRYCEFGPFRYLFHEILVNHEYYFYVDNETPFIIDCGSNIGMSVLFFKLLYPGAHILAFEPGADAFTCLRYNTEANGLENVRLEQKAVSDMEGVIPFYVDQVHPGSLIMSTRRQGRHTGVLTVQSTILSKYVTRQVDFLKLDVEGAEDAVLEDLNRAGKLGHISQMAVEYHHHIDRNKDRLSRLLVLLENNGFGYQIAGSLSRPFEMRQFQDILIYAYQKRGLEMATL